MSMQELNDHVSTINRVVVHPKYRSIGLGAKLIRETLPLVGTPYVEMIAVMATELEAARFLVLLGKEQAAEVLKHLSEEEVAGITKEIAALERMDTDVIGSLSIADAESLVISDPGIDCILLDWDIGDAERTHDEATRLIELIRSRNTVIPVFLTAERTEASGIPKGIMEKVGDFIWLLEDTPAFIAGRIVAAMGRYRRQMAPISYLMSTSVLTLTISPSFSRRSINPLRSA
jgi:hypothetical protein